MKFNVKKFRESDFSVFAYSHIHLFSFMALISEKYMNQKKDYIIDFYITKNLEKDFLFLKDILILFFNSKDKKLIIKMQIFSSPGTGKGLNKKVLGYFYNFFKFKHFVSKKCFIPNSANPYISLCLKRSKANKIINIDEGFSLASLKRYFELGQKSLMYKFFQLLPNIKISPCLLDLNSQDPAFYFKSNEINKLLIKNKKKRKVYELSLFLENFMKNIKPYYLEKYNNNFSTSINKGNYLFVVTSPLSTNKYTEYFEQEIDLIESFLEVYIEKNPNVNIVIKPHYRESVYKYEKLKNKNKSIKIMSPNQPFQLIAMLYENLEIVCFHSSAVFSISFLKNIKKIYCLCPQVKTKAMLTISDSLKNFNSEKINFMDDNSYTIWQKN